MAKAPMFSRRGNTSGFTIDGFPVVGGFMPKGKYWYVYADSGLGALTNSRRRTFDTLAQATAYANTLIDATKTEELKWW